MTYAKVIVDVPSKETNRPYDYVIPPKLSGWVEIGSRVGVPFGPRILQGFVVGLHQEAEVDAARIKPIAEVSDSEPPLTPELVKLSRWMSKTYLCHDITALQAMIPGALKAKYERYIQAAEGVTSPQSAVEHGVFAGGEMTGNGQGILFESETLERESILRYVIAKGPVKTEQLLLKFEGQATLIKQMLLSGQLTEAQVIKDRLSQKKVLTVYPNENKNEIRAYLDKLPANAKRQKDVLDYLLLHHEPVKLADLLAELDLSASTVKSLAEKGMLIIREADEFRNPYEGRDFTPTLPMLLTPQQQIAYDAIRQDLDDRIHRTYLLQGVTGSGKTEVYLQTIQRTLDAGREAIVLVPEISLTPQMVERFKGRFGDQVAVLHSRLSQGERYDEWRKIRAGQVTVAIGARSAIFAPFTKIGLIIIDEEHESSYKQEESPKYHAKRVAIERACAHDAVVVLGSATPSLETFYQTKSDLHGVPVRLSGGEPAIRLITMSERVAGRPMPEVKIVDLREELKAGNRSMFSRELYSAIETRLHKKEQTVLLLNRRGYSTFVMCRSCGFVAGCPHCDISLTYHQRSRNLRCHYCGYAEREPEVCPDCKSEHIRFFGTGTQKVEEELGKLFPGIRVIRMDVDTTTEKGSHEKWLTQFRNKEADVLLGTQMVAKGLDFPDVTLVGVIAADTVLNLPDFRAGEKTFQLLTQVAGRAGRHHLPGEVVIQSYSPEHYSIEHASRHDYDSFVMQELGMRKERGYPPYCRLILITMSHEHIPVLVQIGEALANTLRERAGAAREGEPSFEVMGPVASPIPRIKDRYRFQCMVKYREESAAIEAVKAVLASFESRVKPHKIQISVDVDPQILM
ncbi:primosomal protein DnaI [Paenibacillus swuensis]|uniref:Replication restart protein PriA n=1 Tax=Paenibacillus swuensis TaxID=1178515 RepID=A0A172TKB1_9BACL|nr:primosomal protein N' [Paenibacillus swuensis]ANE47478.1 primosomal protein DnaI [Paenibacillus swuensis]